MNDVADWAAIGLLWQILAIASIAVVVWLLLMVRDIRDSLRTLVTQQEEMLLLHRAWHRLAQRIWAHEPPAALETEEHSD